jgi:predicted phosphodiesterase
LFQIGSFEKMRYLVLTDIHANIDALTAIDEDFDQILVLGDLVDYGAAPEETVQWIMKNEFAAVSGNHDYAMSTGEDCRSSPVSYELSVATRKFFKPKLSSDTLNYLHGLPERQMLKADGATFHLVHATPRDPLFEYLDGDADETVWRSAVGRLANEEAWLFVGHTHRPFSRKIGKLTIVNPGSLGMPIDGDPRGCYAIWEDGRVSLRRIAYDVDRAVKRLFDSGLPRETAERMSSVLRHAGRSG